MKDFNEQRLINAGFESSGLNYWILRCNNFSICVDGNTLRSYCFDGQLLGVGFILGSQKDLEAKINQIHEALTGETLNFEGEASPYKGHEARIKELEDKVERLLNNL